MSAKASAGQTQRTSFPARCEFPVFLFLFFPQMTKKIKKLEKETAMYRSRWESSNKALVDMAEEVVDTQHPISFSDSQQMQQTNANAKLHLKRPYYENSTFSATVSCLFMSTTTTLSRHFLMD